MSTGLYLWSSTAAANATADGSVNMAEGMPPSAVNDGVRALMAAAAKYRDDISGAMSTAGTTTAYTISTSQGFVDLTHMIGQQIAFTPHTTSGDTVTLNVDGLGAKPLRQSQSGLELPAGTLVAGTPYRAAYSSTSEWILQGLAGNPYGIPIGGMLAYTGATAPNAAFVLPSGQAISRSTYATYFALVSTTYGSGDGSTTFNVIDLRGRVPAGKDDMNGSAASRLTSTYFGGSGSTLGAVGGSESQTLTASNLPTITPAGSVSAPSITAKRRNRSDTFSAGATEFITENATDGNSVDNAVTASAPTFTGTPFGSGTAHNNTQPTIIVNYILRVL